MTTTTSSLRALLSGDGESRWLLLKDNSPTSSIRFEASPLPDDGYTFKSRRLRRAFPQSRDGFVDEKESSRVEIDTTAPRIEGLTASTESNGELHVTFHAVDGF